ncbi:MULTISPECIES: envelope stress response activation lipoprotein NlpE [unclassified Leclercia]|uniref:envelope stress response activation lipoprotein NlpE n=1 Tax=unclassified Leclercia TaxID=2627398 RepID=UPI000DF38F37|nr:MULTISPECIES: envelope stress response activation lipoprotein NlpE [unclassified Leclercia]AXF66150.1 copper homeostasis/adhesion lipoprotein NlpE [Leclercia sp. W17]
MKTAIFSVVAAGALVILMGCHNRAEVQALEPAHEEALKPMQQSWRGILPCADCEGIETSLFLEKDGTWVMNQHYQGAKAPSSFASYGSWARTADKLVLTDTQGEKHYFRAKGEGLEMLDREGNPIESQFNYTLAPVNAALPSTPMAMRGMYFYMADAATFTDCATGKKVSVANNAQLERDYAAARGNDTKPVLLTVNGHFTLEANPDSGEKVKMLVPDRDARFEADKNCGSK